MLSDQPRRPTLEDVAARAGVSRALVSIVMREVPGASDATRQRVLAVAEELGYRPDARARLLAGRSSTVLGVTLALNNPFHADVTEAIYTAAEAAGYEVVLSAITERRPAGRATDALLDYRCDAAILVGSVADGLDLTVLGRRLPVVVVGQPSPSPSVSVIRVDDMAGIRLAVDHLVGLGHRDVVHLDGGGAPGAVERRTGYVDAMRAHRLDRHIRVLPAGPEEADGAEQALRLLDEATLPTALLAYNDRCAVGAVESFVRHGVDVPAEVSVIGYDDSRVARFPYLQLTTVSQDAAHMGAAAVDTAIARLAGKRVRRQRILAPQLVVRKTTAGPRA